MKRFIFYLLLAVAVFLVYRIIKIIYYYFYQLTDYVLGFLVGELILLVLVLVLAFVVGRRIYRN